MKVFFLVIVLIFSINLVFAGQSKNNKSPGSCDVLSWIFIKEDLLRIDVSQLLDGSPEHQDRRLEIGPNDRPIAQNCIYLDDDDRVVKLLSEQGKKVVKADLLITTPFNDESLDFIVMKHFPFPIHDPAQHQKVWIELRRILSSNGKVLLIATDFAQEGAGISYLSELALAIKAKFKKITYVQQSYKGENISGILFDVHE